MFKFLFRNLKGLRWLIVIAILVTILQVFCAIGAAWPLKFITSKVQNSGNDPTCTLPFLKPLLDPVLDKFDNPQFDPSLAPLTPGGPPQTPGVSPCPISSAQTNVITTYSHHSTNGVIVFSLILLVIFGSLAAILGYLDLYIAAFIGQNLTARLRNQLFDHLQRLSLDWHGTKKKGDLVQRITGNIADIEKLVTDGLVDILSATLTITCIAAVMLFLQPEYTVISLAIAPLLFVLVIVYTKSIKGATKRAAKAAGQVADVATEDINALTVIKVFTREEREAVRFGQHVDESRRAGLRAGGLQAQFAPLVGFLIALGTATIVGVGGYVAAGNSFNVGFFTIPASSVDIGTLIIFLIFLGLLYQPMRDVSKLLALSSSASAAVERIEEVLNQAPEVLESDVPYHGPAKLRGDITFDNVVFGYTSGVPVLKGINLHIPQGKKIALVGLSGGGKTTLVKLIPRFYQTQQGSVRIDGVDNRMYPLNVLRQNVSMVLQDSVLFEGTIRENISLGKPGANDYEVIEAAKKANIHEMILRDLGGYDGVVREQGKNLSGGQRQRIAIARAILRDAPILILDEPTAALDVESEVEVMHALNNLIVGRTVIMISHRLSTLGNVEEIVVLKEGRIAERGTFNELKRRGGVFAALLEEQNRYNLEKASEQSMILEKAGAHSIIRSAYAPIPGFNEHYQAQPRPQQPMRQASPQAMSPAPSHRQQDGNGRRQPQPAVVPPINARIVIEVDGKILGDRPLNKPVMTVGRLSVNDIQVPSQRVSRLHAKIRWENNHWLIEDADSLNGLVYRGIRIDRLALNNGDRVYITPTAALQYITQ